MRRLIVTIMASLLSCTAAHAFWPEATDSSLEVGVGYRKDKLEWKTSSHSGSGSYGSYGSSSSYDADPVELESKLKWKDLQIWQLDARGKYVTCDSIYLRADADYGWITDGKNTDKDSIVIDSGYGHNGSGSFELAKSKSKSTGHVYDVDVAIGYEFKLCDDSFSIAPLIGYSWNGQHIKDSHLKEEVYLDDANLIGDNVIRSHRSSDASFSRYGDSYGSCSSGGKNGKYKALWNGPFIGFDFDYRFGCGCEADWEVFGTYEFHWAKFHGKGHWPLRRDLVDGKFRHHAKDAYGQVFDIGIKWDFCECWTVALKGEFQWWWADKGRDRAKIERDHNGNVKTDCYISVPLHDIKHDAAAIIVDFGMVF